MLANSSVKLNWHCVAFAGCQFSFKISSNIYWASIKWNRLVVDSEANAMNIVDSERYICGHMSGVRVWQGIGNRYRFTICYTAAEPRRTISFCKESINFDGAITMLASSALNRIRAEAHSINRHGRRGEQSAATATRCHAAVIPWWRYGTCMCDRIVRCLRNLIRN